MILSFSKTDLDMQSWLPIAICNHFIYMEADINAIVHSCCELIPIMNWFSIMCTVISLPAEYITIQVLIIKDNTGALVPAKNLLPKFIFQSNCYHTKTIWFWQGIAKHRIKLLGISTTKQLGDLFTKGIPKEGFECILETNWWDVLMVTFDTNLLPKFVQKREVLTIIDSVKIVMVFLVSSSSAPELFRTNPNFLESNYFIPKNIPGVLDFDC